MSSLPQTAPLPLGALGRGSTLGRVRRRLDALPGPRPELALLMALAAALNLWALGRNGWANDYYSAAVRSMSTSWHDFLFASLDRTGVMSVDKPPLSLWVQALSVRAFGYHPLSVLVPQALMGVASVALLYDLVRRTFGRAAGFTAGLALALTPIFVAVSRHNNPDALLVLCSVAALWFAVRALQDGRTRWLVLCGVCVGLGFETKMLVALVVVPGIAAAWLWTAPAGRGRLHAARQLLGAGGAMALVAGAWPALIEIVPAADRPWVSGTGDNRVLSLIFGYNGLGRVEGQSGGPGGGPGGGGNMFGGSPGPLRLLNSALGGQGGWLLGFALVGGVAILLASRLRRLDARSGWLIAVGGAFATTAVLFSFAGGIFHPYYVSLLAPFAAALTGAGAVQLVRGLPRPGARALAVLAVLAGVVVELVVAGRYPGQLTWLPAALPALAIPAAAVLGLSRARRVRVAALAVAVGALLLAPGAWALDTLGYPASGTFPAGGPAAAAQAGGGRFGGFSGAAAGAPRSGLAPMPAGGAAGHRAGLGGPPAGSAAVPPGLAGGGAPSRALPGPPASGGGPSFAGRGVAGAGGPFGQEAGLSQALRYVRAHGGGTIALSSQSGAAAAIVAEGAQVAGIGGFSGRESSVTVAWLAEQVRSGRISWVLGSGQQAGGGLPRDTRAGSRAAIAAVEGACRAVSLSSSDASASAFGGSTTLYDCRGRAASLEAAARG